MWGGGARSEEGSAARSVRRGGEGGATSERWLRLRWLQIGGYGCGGYGCGGYSYVVATAAVATDWWLQLRCGLVRCPRRLRLVVPKRLEQLERRGDLVSGHLSGPLGSSRVLAGRSRVISGSHLE